MNNKIWNTGALNHYDEYMEFINAHYKKSIESLVEQTNNKLNGEITYDAKPHTNGSYTITMGLDILYDYKGDQYTFNLINTDINIHPPHDSIMRISYKKYNGSVSIKVDDFDDFEDKFYNILMYNSTGNIISKLLNVSNDK